MKRSETSESYYASFSLRGFGSSEVNWGSFVSNFETCYNMLHHLKFWYMKIYKRMLEELKDPFDSL